MRPFYVQWNPQYDASLLSLSDLAIDIFGAWLDRSMLIV